MDTESGQQEDHGGQQGEDAHAPALPGPPPNLTDLGEAYAELVEWMADEIDTDRPSQGLEDQTVANAILRRVGMLERRLALREEVYTAELLRLTEYIEHQRATLGEAIERDRRWLAGWHAAMLGPHHRGPKTIELPAGVLKATKEQPAYEVDAEAFLAWAEEHAPELVRVPPPKIPPPAPDKLAIKKRVGPVLKERTDWRAGETVSFPDMPGVVVTMPGYKFDAKPDRD